MTIKDKIRLIESDEETGVDRYAKIIDGGPQTVIQLFTINLNDYEEEQMERELGWIDHPGYASDDWYGVTYLREDGTAEPDPRMFTRYKDAVAAIIQTAD
jgi:hypothetical protein